jgi:4'-phosphopantetheinyl transferase EntD
MLRLGTTLERALSDLRPGHAASVVEPIDLEKELFAAEVALISESAPRRKREFSTGRRCARRASLSPDSGRSNHSPAGRGRG